jgi:small-conductance mechanosensitive channel/CRP-like cAMP-binding protein
MTHRLPSRSPAGIVAALVALTPSVALAAGAVPSIIDGFASMWVVAAQIASVVLIAYLVNRFAPRKRKHVRRSLLVLLAYLASLGAAAGLGAAGIQSWAAMFHALGEALGVLVTVNVVGVALFDLALPGVGLEPAIIVTDLVMGAAYVVTTIAVLRHAGVDFSGIITTSAVVTGILALSLQSTLGNVIGGVALQIDDSIHVGDWIQLENGKQGRVRQIRWRHTVIETRDWDTLIVPNAALLSANIIILGKREGEPVQHRMWVYFNVPFKFRPSDVIRAVEEALRAAPMEGVAETPPPNCICFDFAKDNRDSFAYYAVRYWLTDLARDDPTSSLVRTRIHAALQRAGIPFALPSAHYLIESDDSERYRRKAAQEHDRKVAAVRGLSFLEGLTSAELSDVAESLRYAPFAAGETITRQGAVAHWLYIVNEGTAEVRVISGSDDKVVAKIEAPGFFGEMGLLTGAPRTATVVALTDVVCYRLDKQVFVRILNERPAIAAQISSMLAERQVGLVAAREDLDEAARKRKVDAEKNRLLSTIEQFFGLAEGAASRRF